MAKEITIKSALHYHDKPIPCNYDLNIYRGCEHKCKYCFAQYSHKYLESTDFFDDIFVKTNVAVILDKELSKKSWKKEPINIGGVTDSYQPLEEQYKLMPDILRVLIKHKNPIILCTKSTLILRDYELIEELAKVADVSIGATITTMNEKIRAIIEPNTSPSCERLGMLKKFKEAGCSTTVLLMPILPYLTDSLNDLDEIFKAIKEVDVDDVHAWTLNLRGNTKNTFFAFIKSTFPHLMNKYMSLYQTSNVSREYNQDINKIVRSLRAKHKIYNSYRDTATKMVNDEQLKFEF